MKNMLLKQTRLTHIPHFGLVTLALSLFLGFFGLTTAGLAQNSSPNPGLPVIELKTGIYRLQVEVAATPQARQTGLMYRTVMAQNAGMLFIFEQKAGHCFWMSNTKIPLSIAFIGDDSKIVNIEEMQADTTNNHCPKAPIRFALEMNQKWFAERALGPGTLIQGLPKN
ncbi:DUF192 domain-containing protein [Polynucleobacter sp. IMCC30063]|nr:MULTISPECIES: DUF192 domain-containing protein [unclassified Polynucleobacter]MCE7506638.1 DUF192 domain-containing protein [Polynucleobacter sp. IMCC30063]MCE7526672.1 DUF192 domain-containing protein [Polynucleobacter sp. IMCC 30228]MCE7530251.1 DUF192 domain-containing protein [Polynucleobacter sp. IMCC 29146]